MAVIKVHIVTMGCAKNSVDSEHTAGYLSGEGHQLVTTPAEADAVIVNTCGFIGPAVEENIELILDLARLKEAGEFKHLVVAGCLSQRYQDDLAAELPEVDAFVGTGGYAEIPQVLAQIESKSRLQAYQLQSSFPLEMPRNRLATGPSAYLKIAEGCPRLCSYCVIPKIRGKLHSRPIADLVKEAHALASSGVSELVLVAQDTTSYGVDLEGQSLLPRLLRELAQVGGISWIRFLYAYPELLSDKLLEVMAKESKITPYLDLPLQHSSKRILQSMGRRGTGAEYLDLLAKIRSTLNKPALRSTFILGYPGETEAEFAQLLEFVDEAQFTNIAAFTFYPEEGTRASELPNQVPVEIARERLERLTSLQEAISTEVNQNRVGEVTEVLVESVQETGFSGRSQLEAPEIDALIQVEVAREEPLPDIGQYLPVRITTADAYNLAGILYRPGK